MEPILVAAVGALMTSLVGLIQTFLGSRKSRVAELETQTALRDAKDAVEQAESEVSEPERTTAEEESSVEEAVAQTRAHLDATLDTLDSLRARIGADIEKLRAQVDAERSALGVLSVQVQERRLFLEMSKDPAQLAEHLDSKISKQTELIAAQSSQVEALQRALEAMRRRAAVSGRWNLVLTILLALVSTVLGLYPIFWA